MTGIRLLNISQYTGEIHLKTRSKHLQIVLSDKIEEIQKDIESGTDPLTIIQSLSNKGAIQIILTEAEEIRCQLEVLWRL